MFGTVAGHMSRPEALGLERTFAPGFDSAREARRFACEAARMLGVEDRSDGLDRVEALVGEMAVNAVLHGRTDYSVAVSAPRSGVIRIELSDGNHELPRRKSATGDDVLMHGRGLHLIDALADRWGVVSRADGKCVWAEVRL